MSIQITQGDHTKLDALLEGVLDAVANGEVSKDQAVEALGHVITAAAIDNTAELQDWIGPDRINKWKQLCKSGA